ncbi:CsbD family protein [Curtobacterium aetherium]|uniref:CsbD family protein n=1 Tax=Curtobacterium aetherium TaxID=2841594 RepID=A0ACD1E0U1_9MICO|nr:CsbD family protein [Curtobacterium sp. L6-1]QWS32529.1 CsbD family protein [Curtobacterium sp. L6-1]
MGLDDKIKNAAQDLAGKAKEAVGHLTNDDAKVAEGEKDQAAASAKQTGEDVKDVFRK